ncbi:hypothetical protein NKG94_38965 [Micromonospora sp. M12]
MKFLTVQWLDHYVKGEGTRPATTSPGPGSPASTRSTGVSSPPASAVPTTRA